MVLSPESKTRMQTMENNKNSGKKTKKKGGRFFIKFLLVLCYLVLFFLIAAIAAGIIIINSYGKDLPNVDLLTKFEPSETSIVYASDGTVIATLFRENRYWVPLEEIPADMKNAIVAIEDSRFYTHPGIDLKAITRSLIVDLKGGTATQGASTITMQLAREIFLHPKKTIRRKIQEIIISLQIERRFTKNEILERYLNQIYVNKTVINMLNLPLSYFQNSQDGILMSKVQNLFQFSEFFIHLYNAMFIDLILLIGLFIALTIYSVSIALITSCFFIVIAFLLFRYLKQINSMNKKIISSQEMMNQGHLEYLRNIYNSHQFFVKSFARNKINFLFEDYNYFLYRRNNALNRINGISELLIGTLLYSVVLIACFYYKQARLSVGEIVFFYLLISYMIEPLFNIISFVLEKDEVLILFERYRELLPEKKTKKMYFKGPIKQIKFDHISYSYGYSKPIIEHLDLTITKSIWLKGDTGAGKSTLLKLLMNYDQLLKGKILINGIDLQKIDVNSLYQKMIYLDKEPIFYRESLRFNLLLNRHNEKMMNFLLKEFKMEEFINKLDMIISDDGHPLSSGQAQIMMLIRSLLKRPQVLILDEALCNVDETRLMLIMDYLKSLDGKLIVIIVAHQTKLMNELFDCVIIEHGKIRK